MESFPWEPREQRCLWVPLASWVSAAGRAIPKQADRKISKTPSRLSTQVHPSLGTLMLSPSSSAFDPFFRPQQGHVPCSMVQLSQGRTFAERAFVLQTKGTPSWERIDFFSVWLKSSRVYAVWHLCLLPLCLSSTHLSPPSRQGESSRISGPCAHNPL